MAKFKLLYLVTNPSMPGLVKIGETDDIAERWGVLNRSSSCPEKFVVQAVYRLDRRFPSDRQVHELLAPYRHNTHREFFRVDVLTVRRLLADHGLREVDAVDGSALHTNGRRRRANTTPKSIGEPSGVDLRLKGHPSVRAKWLKTGQVKYKGEVMSMSIAAVRAREDVGRPLTASVNGSLYWCPKDSQASVADVRRRKEEGKRQRLAA